MNIDDTKIVRAVELLKQHEKAKQACIDFMKSEGESAYDPIALKLWLADRITNATHMTTPSETAELQLAQSC